MTATYEALDPCSDEPSIERTPLADRPTRLDGLRIALIQTMPPGSGLEPVIDALSDEVAAVCPTARPTHYMRKNFMATDLAEVDRLAADFDVAVAVAGPAGTMVHLAVILAAELERRGVPCPVVHFETLQATAQHSVSTSSAQVRIWPIGNPPRTAQASAAAARMVVSDLTNPARADEQVTGWRHPAPRARIAARGSLAEINDRFLANGWTDGLPIVPPTQADVAAMLRGTSRTSDTIVSETFRPEGRRVTVEMVAINAVMAGARPDYLPVILATASVFGDIQFESMTRSVNSFAFAQLVSGPISREIGMAGGLNALGPGHRANATIGRVVNLMLRTLGGAQLGVNTTPTQGSAVSWAFAFAENEAGSPWQPFHVDLGYEANVSVVSILLGGWAHNGNYYYGDLDDVASTLQDFEIPQTGALVMLSEKRAQHLAADGYTKQDVTDHLHERATIRLGTFRASGFFPMMRNDIAGLGPSTAPSWPADYLTRPDDDVVPAYPPGGIRVAVVGSDVSSTMQAWKLQLHRSVSVDDWR
ncbi:MAG: hypothetical protein ABI862_00565 [Ilumatobacteraceae bacterium]